MMNFRSIKWIGFLLIVMMTGCKNESEFADTAGEFLLGMGIIPAWNPAAH